MRIEKKKHRFSLGVDIGGTFTDFALLDTVTGEARAAKVLTRYNDLTQGVLDGIRDLAQDVPDCANLMERVVHGTTLATNALIQRRGAKTALLVTAGFRDVLQLGRESRFDIYDINIDTPRPLVPRRYVFEIRERLDHEGRVVTPLDETEVEAAIERMDTAGIEAVAVCFLHAFRNPVHERRVAELVARALPQIALSISSDVMPDVREYERASTTAANAYVQPAIRGYLDNLAAGLKRVGVQAPLSIMTSDGGIVSCDTAARYPVRLIESGPAGGAIASAYFSAGQGMDRAIALDMGGTTAKICVIDEGRPEQSTEFEVDRVFRFAKGSGLPLKIPVIEMIEIGAGGGSIAGVSGLGLLQVGPASAGSDPGPACYALGGAAPTVTDADLYLGYLDPAYFLGGKMALDYDAAARAIDAHLARPLGLTTVRAAWGIHEVVNENMARAAKVHCLERGKDPREYTLIAYGGAGPVHAYRVAQTLGMRRIFYPLRAGVMSAFGFLVAPPAFEMVRADVSLIEAVDVARVNEFLAEMHAEGRALVATCGVPVKQLTATVEANVRFQGQSFELPVAASYPVTRNVLAGVRQRYFKRYEGRYHRLHRDVPVEIVSWRVVIRGPAPKLTLRSPRTASASSRYLKGRRKVFMPEAGRYIDCPIYDRYALRAGQRLRGPAVIEEHESTAVIGLQASVEVDRSLNLWVILPGDKKTGVRRTQ